MTDRRPRIYFPNPLAARARFTLSGDAHRHLAHVLRLKPGDGLTLFDGRGGEYPATIESVNRGDTIVHTDQHVDVDNESNLPLHLAQGISRGERTDYAIQKAVELGVTSIVPLLTRRGVVRLASDRARRRLDHWKAVAVHACQQCGRNRVPHLHPIVTLEEWLGDTRADALNLVMDPEDGTGLGAFDYSGGPVTLLVGPEGGLESGEIEASLAVGFRRFTLGPRTLRTETAAAAGVTAIQLTWGDLDSGP